MKKKSIFEGVATALITPLTKDGVDYEKLGELIDWQIASGVNGLVICGTTGEGSTLTDDEHRKVLEYAVKRIGGKVPAIAGTGSNDTAYAIDLSQYAASINYDGMLLVTPYYNKATQNGLIKSFEKIADSMDKPCILYNVPSRTGVNIEPSTYKALSEHPNISAIKEANGNLSKIVETLSLVGDKLDVYSGNDDQAVPIISIGGKGVISVLSNVLPEKTVKMCKLALEGKTKEAMELQCDMLPLINALFSEVNPIPVKAAMAGMGYCENIVRLPLTEMEENHKAKLFEYMREQGIRV